MLENYTEKDVPSESISPIIEALFKHGDGLLRPEDEATGIFGHGNDINIARIVFQLVRRLDETERVEVIKNAVSNSTAVSTITREVSLLKPSDRPEGQLEEMVSADHLSELKEQAVGKIRASAQSGSLLQAPQLSMILYRWLEWDDSGLNEWVKRTIATDEGLLELLEGFLHRGYSQGLSDAIGQVTYRLNPKNMEPFLVLSEIVDRVKGLRDKEGLSDNQKTAIEQFILGYEMIERGEDPDSPF